MTRRTRIAGYTYKRNGKKITVKSYLKNGNTKTSRSKGRKTSPGKKQSKPSAGYDRDRKGTRSGGVSKRTRHIEKVPKKNKVSIPSKRDTRRKGRGKAKKHGRPTQVKIRHPRKHQQIELTYTSVRSLERKIDLIASEEKIEAVIDNQLDRFDGRPPLGIVVLFEDDNGHIASRLSPPEMVINTKNVIDFIRKCLREMDNDYDPEMDIDEDESGFSTHDPSKIIHITIKFFYGKT